MDAFRFIVGFVIIRHLFYNGMNMFIINWLISLFIKTKKKEKKLVAIITGKYSFIRQYRHDWESLGQVVYYLYEDEDGKRKVELTRNTDHLALGHIDLKTTKHWNVIESWERGEFSSSKIPSYMMAMDLVKPLVLDLRVDDYLNELL